MARRIGAPAAATAALVLLLLGAVPAAAGTVSGSFASSAQRVRTYADALGTGSATAAAGDDASGALSVSASAADEAPFGTFPLNASIGLGATASSAAAWVEQELNVSGPGAVQVIMDGITASSMAECDGCTLAGAYLQGAYGNVVAYARAVFLDGSRSFLGYRTAQVMLSSNGAPGPASVVLGTDCPSAANCLQVLDGTQWVQVEAGLIASAQAAGPAAGEAQASGTVTSISAP